MEKSALGARTVLTTIAVVAIFIVGVPVALTAGAPSTSALQASINQLIASLDAHETNESARHGGAGALDVDVVLAQLPEVPADNTSSVVLRISVRDAASGALVLGIPASNFTVTPQLACLSVPAIDQGYYLYLGMDTSIPGCVWERQIYSLDIQVQTADGRQGGTLFAFAPTIVH